MLAPVYKTLLFVASAGVFGLLGTSFASAQTITSTHITTPHDTIPRYCSPSLSTISTNQSGPWSDPNTWDQRRLPTDNDKVRITANHSLTYDLTSSPSLDCLELEGSLTFNTNQNTQLKVTTLTVLPQGTLTIGTESNPINTNHTAELIIADRPLDTTFDPQQYGHGLLGLGTITMHGATKNPTFVRLSKEPKAGDTTLDLEEAVSGWQVGDRLFLPDTTQITENDKFNVNYVLKIDEPIIQAISQDGRVITITQPLLYNHKGARDANSTPTVLPNGIKLLPHIGNLTRNIVIKSENPASTRGHILLTHRASAYVAHVQFQDLGRTKGGLLNSTTFNAQGDVTSLGTNQIGRYPLHAHHLWGPVNASNTGYQFQFVGNAVADSLKWPMAIHNSHYGLIKDNVVFGGEGGGIVTEDGTETDNLFENNFVAKITAHFNPRDSGNADSPGTGAECFWARGFNNRYRNNIASTCRNTAQQIVSGVGWKFFTASAETANTRQPLRRGADLINGAAGVDYQLVNRQLQPILEYDSNEVYGATMDGLTVWELGTSGYNEPEATETIIKNMRVWHTHEAAIWNYPNNRVTIDGLVYRVDPMVTYCCSNHRPGAISSGDYRTVDLTVRSANVHAGNLFGGAINPIGTLRFENNSVVSSGGAFGFSTPATPGTGAGQLPVTMILDNNDIQPWPGLPLQVVNMHYGQFQNPDGTTVFYGKTHLTQDYKVIVCNYQGESNSNFQVYWKQQRADHPIPQTVTNPNFPQFILLNACPSPDMTNSQCLAAHGVTTAGEIAACEDDTTHPEIYGFTCQTALADSVCSNQPLPSLSPSTSPSSSPSNQPPVITASGPTQVRIGSSITLDIDATDSDSSSVDLILTNLSDFINAAFE